MDQIVIHSLLSDAAYIDETGAWTTLFAKARKFSSAREADRLARAHKLNKVEILVFRNGQIVTNFPVDLSVPGL